VTPESRLKLRRLHSASGVVPLGVFLCEHLWNCARVLRGRGSFDRSLSTLPLVVNVLVILLPLAFHALYGIVLFREAHPNEAHYSHTRTPLFWLQRVTGAIVLVFVVVHVLEFRSMAPSSLFGAMV
jgi:succinate dehydrogenase / fumarate reductase, cytochrome b subunit